MSCDINMSPACTVHSLTTLVEQRAEPDVIYARFASIGGFERAAAAVAR